MAPNPRLLRIGSLAVAMASILALLFSVSLHAQQAEAEGGTLNEGITLEMLESDAARLAEQGTPESEALLEGYREAIKVVEKAREQEAKAQLYRNIIAGESQWRDRLKVLRERSEKAAAELPPLPKRATLDALTKELDREQADYRITRNQAQEMGAVLAKLRLRPDRSAAELTEARQRLAEVEESLQALADGSGGQGKRLLLQARKRELASRITLLELERLSHPMRLEEAELHAATATAELQRGEMLTRRLQERINELHAAEAEETLAKVASQLDAGPGNPVIQEIFETIGERSRRLKRLAEEIEGVTHRHEEVSLRVERMRDGRERIRRQMEILGLDESLGQLLRLERRRIPKVEQLQGELERIRETLSEVRIAAFHLENESVSLDPVEGDKGEREAATLFVDNPPAEREVLLEHWKAARATDAELRERLLSEYGRYEKALGDLRLEYRLLIDTVGQYRHFVDRNMVWVRGSALLSGDLLASVDMPLTWVIHDGGWGEAAGVIWEAWIRNPLIAALSLALALAAFLSRGWMREREASWNVYIGKVRHDRFTYSVATLAFGLVIVLGPIVPLIYLGLVMRGLGDYPAVSAVGAGLFEAAFFALLLLGALELYRPAGIAREHFRWDERRCDLLYRSFRIFTPILLPLVFLIGMLEWVPGEVDRNMAARILFVIANLVVLWWMHRLFYSDPNVLEGLAGRRRLTLARLLALGVPLGLALLAFFGYYYGALQLSELIAHSLMVIVVIGLLHGMARRRLMIAQRRLALRRARERRAAILESRAKEQESGGNEIFEGVPMEVEEQIDLETIDGQTRTMLRMMVVVLAAGVLSMLWSELIPALGGLDEIVLWEHSSGGEGSVGQGVTLWSLMLALLVLGITFVAANNLPGVLEIAVLQPLEVEVGNRYAISLISRYVIVSAGLLTGFVLIGLGWGDVQWLVAAMGVGLGFGLKEIFANFFSGLILLFERPIRIGDWVSIGEFSGSVTRIRIRATTVTDWDNRELIIPNKNFLTETLNNWSLTDSVTRVVVKVGIAYGSDTEKALRLMRDIIDEHPDVMKDPEASVLFLGFGDSALDFEVRVYVEDRLRRLSLTHDLHMRIDQAFRREGIEIAFPQRDLHLRSIDPGALLRVELAGGSPTAAEPEPRGADENKA